jgi:hypothetical protein
MAENGKIHPVRTLTVENFSVIKHAKLKFGKITVLIGPQASGKSLLCKLSYYFGQMVPEIASSLLLLRMSSRALLETLLKEFSERFPIEAWGDGGFRILYVSDSFRISVERKSPSEKQATLKLNQGFVKRYEDWIETHQAEGSATEFIESLRSGNAILGAPIQVESSIYIPTGRAFFSTPNRGFASFSGKNLDWITQRFATEIDWEYKDLIRSSEMKLTELGEFGAESQRVLGGRVLREDGTLLFQSDLDPRKLQFSMLSSGTLELLPLLNPLSQRVGSASIRNSLGGNVFRPLPSGVVFVEEPELGIFPKTQQNLVGLFAWLASLPDLHLSIAITTHSPYILSSFNNLIYAGQLGTDEEIQDDIPILERYWVKTNSFAAYRIRDGFLESILSKKSGLIDGEYLDSVSETIGNEFDSLLRLEYDHTEAS